VANVLEGVRGILLCVTCAKEDEMGKIMMWKGKRTKEGIEKDQGNRSSKECTK
jgi:hypothetical protein